MRRTFSGILCIGILILGAASVTGCRQRFQKASKDTKEESVKEDTKKEEDSSNGKVDKKESKKDDKKEKDVIIAGSVDTSSKFSFSVEEAIIGMSYNDEPIVVLVGDFTNNSDETISFSWALDATAVQNGYSLPTAYLSGSSDFNYNEIAPGSSIPVFLGWKIADGENDITLKVVDNQHYAKEEIYSQTFTIDELVQNTQNYQGSEDVIDEPLTL